MKGLGLGLRKLAVNTTGTFIRQLIASLLQLVIIVIIARIYGPEGNGNYVVALLLPSLLATFLNLGIAPANVYFIGSGKIAVITAWRSTVKLYFALSILGLAIGAAVLWWRAEQWFPGVSPKLLWFSLTIFPISFLLGFVSSIFQGLQQFRIFNVVLLAQPIITLTIITILLLFGSSDIVWLLASYLLGLTITLLISLYFLQPFLKQTEGCEIEKNYSLTALNYGYKAHLGNILAFINYKADIFLVNFFVGSAGAGVYVIAVLLVERLWMFSQAVGTVLLPRLSELSKDEAKRKLITPLISRWIFFLTLLGSVTLAVVARPVIELVFGADYLTALMPLWVLLPGVVAMSVVRILANDLAARGRPELNMYITVPAVIVNLVGNILLIPEYGLVGAAAATSLCYITIFVLLIYMYWRQTGIIWHQTIFIKKSDVSVLKSLLTK